MRELKLRYFWKGQWYYIDLYKDNTRAKFEAYESVKCSQFYQYTGLLDKNGKEIFEGDIVVWKHLNDKDFYEVYYNPDEVHYFAKTAHGETESYLDSTHMEIIGNIYEDPELLK